jgi:hypothetical protein
MSNTPRTIYRRPEHAGKAPITKSVNRAGLPMLTLDPKRLARAGSISTTGRRRVYTGRVVVTFLLAGLVLLGAIFVIALSGAGLKKAHGQGIVSPAPWCMVSSPVAPAMECIQPRAHLPIVEVTR